MESRTINFDDTVRGFTFDFDLPETIPPSALLVADAESLIAISGRSLSENPLAFGAAECLMFAGLCYRLGSFYNHVRRLPDLALPKLLLAQTLFKASQSDFNRAYIQTLRGFVDAHIAFSYQQKMFKDKEILEPSEKTELFQNGLQICSDLIIKTTPESTHLLGFIYCVQALLHYEQGDRNEAISSYRDALDLYERHDFRTNQYARALNRFAQICAEHNDMPRAEESFGQLVAYWRSHEEENTQPNPYAARFFVSYAEFLEKYKPTETHDILSYYLKASQIMHDLKDESTVFGKSIQEKVHLLQEKTLSSSKMRAALLANSTFAPAAAQELPQFRSLYLHRALNNKSLKK